MYLLYSQRPAPAAGKWYTESMNKKLIYVVIGIIVLIVAAMTYILVRPSMGDVVGQITTPVSEDTKNDTETPIQNDTPGVYREYSDEAIASTTGTKLLFFHAPWCPQCRSIEDSIEKDGVPSGVTVFKVDYDSNQKLRQQYGVTIQTSFVKVDDSGNKVDSYVAYDEPVFSSVERELLK